MTLLKYCSLNISVADKFLFSSDVIMFLGNKLFLLAPIQFSFAHIFCFRFNHPISGRRFLGVPIQFFQFSFAHIFCFRFNHPISGTNLYIHGIGQEETNFIQFQFKGIQFYFVGVAIGLVELGNTSPLKSRYSLTAFT